MADETNDTAGLSLRELVLEMRNDVKSLATQTEVTDHETRLRSLERWRGQVTIPVAAMVTAFTAMGAKIFHLY